SSARVGGTGRARGPRPRSARGPRSSPRTKPAAAPRARPTTAGIRSDGEVAVVRRTINCDMVVNYMAVGAPPMVRRGPWPTLAPGNPTTMSATAESTIRVTLPDGSQRELAAGTTGADLAAA